MKRLGRISNLAQRPAIIAAIALGLSACAGSASGGSPAPPTGPPGGAPGKRYPHIHHVVIVVQENRSVDNLFQGFPGADAQPYGFDRSGDKIKLMPVPLEAPWDFHHDSTSFFNACDGQGSFPGTNCKMDGFDREYWDCGKAGYVQCPNAKPPYSYVPHNETQPYFFIGKHYVFRG